MDEKDKNKEDKGRRRLDIALVVCLSLCVACNAVQIVLKIIEMAK